MEITQVHNSWELASLVCKFLFYIGAAASLGSAVSLCLYHDGRRATVHRLMCYQLIGGLIGFQAVLINFLVQVGLANNSGLAGAFDWFMAEILLDTPLGDLSFLRLAGFALVIVNSVFFLRRLASLSTSPPLRFYRRAFTAVGIGFILLLVSFRLGGHVSVLSTNIQLALAVHFTCFAIWVGSLYPLWVASTAEDRGSLQITLRRFGDHALVFVGFLLMAGLWLILNLINSPLELIETGYGRALSIKLLLVVGILAIAAINKIKLVPVLLESGGVKNFQKSLRLEIAVAAALLLATAWLSTVVGPAMAH
jgi:putative copper resistance protein D